ncbi:MAG: response regulator [Xanthomonadales bacterium]|nr:response regulator [Xanthomonadales bacterium]
MRLLLVEDDALLGEGLQTSLRRAGYTVDWFQDGRHALDALLDADDALAVLDLGLPRKDGIEIIRAVRAAGRRLPILVLTARDQVKDRVQALDAGADDFLGKPFDPEELLARLRALLRRVQGRTEDVLRLGELTIDPKRFEVTWRGERIDLPRREFAVLSILVENAGRVVRRESLRSSLYGWDEDVASNAVEVHVYNLRKKIRGELIRTVRGVGYVIDLPSGP